MPRRKKGPDREKMAQILAESRRGKAVRQDGYRERAMAIFPHICGRCGRDFDAKNLSELTVHHKDHNHHNNPPDGSNWELLCVYCHDDEHQKSAGTGIHGKATPDQREENPLDHRPFEGLSDLVLPESDDPGSG